MHNPLLKLQNKISSRKLRQDGTKFLEFMKICYNSTPWVKKTRHQTLVHNFAKIFDRFSKFVHCYIQQEICSKTMIKCTTTSWTGRYTIPCEILMSENSVFYIWAFSLKYKLAEDLSYDMQQLLWQKQVILIVSIDFDSQINECHTSVARFRQAVCHRRCAQRQFCFFVAADEYDQLFC